ncbi:MAG: CoA-binding protein [Sulfurihydrogenibium sp.]
MPILKTDEEIKKVLENSKTVAVVGISEDPSRPSYFVSEAIKSYGFKLYFVNPKYAGKEILGEKVYKSILDIPDEIDIVDVFRRPADVVFTAEEALKKGFKTFWFQPGTYNPEVAEELNQKGYNVVIDKCMKVETQRLLKN